MNCVYVYRDSMRHNNIVSNKLYELGKTLGMENNEIDKAKRTMKSMLSMFIMAGIVILIGKFITSQLDAVGLYYIGVSIKDFGMLSRFF